MPIVSVDGDSHGNCSVSRLEKWKFFFVEIGEKVSREWFEGGDEILYPLRRDLFPKYFIKIIFI
jgi:hypothetical protein